jgi:hypothetical protein
MILNFQVIPSQKMNYLEKDSFQQWESADLNFDWIGSSITTIFVMATQVCNKPSYFSVEPCREKSIQCLKIKSHVCVLSWAYNYNKTCEQDSWDNILWLGVDSGFGATEDDRGTLGRVQYRSMSALAFFIPVHLLCAGLLVPVYLAVLFRCFVIADADVAKKTVRKLLRRRLPDPDDPKLILNSVLGGKKILSKDILSFRQRLRMALDSIYFMLASIMLVVVI